MKHILVCGAGGFIGGHLVKRLKREGFWVRGVDLKHHEFVRPTADEFVIGDLRDQAVAARSLPAFDEVYQLAADMGGAGYIFTGEHDAAVMHNSATINLNMLEFGRTRRGPQVLLFLLRLHLSRATIRPTPTTPTAPRTPPIPPPPTASTAGRSSSANGSTLAYSRNLRHRGARRPLSQYLRARRHLDAADAKRPRPRSAARSPKPPMAARSRSGAMASRPAPSSMSTSASRASAA